MSNPLPNPSSHQEPHASSHPEPTITVKINGADHSCSPATLTELLLQLGLGGAQKGIAVAQNGAIVAKINWPQTRVHAGDELEILAAIQGG